MIPYCYILSPRPRAAGGDAGGRHACRRWGRTHVDVARPRAGRSAAPPAWLLYLLGVPGEIFVLTSIYMVMPVGRLRWRTR
ncbi:MAG: hypothetical protein MZV65_37010 [Chromatiales bacterium]|nr:hypothetical protein [Chromatiales bacterium]